MPELFWFQLKIKQEIKVLDKLKRTLTKSPFQTKLPKTFL